MHLRPYQTNLIGKIYEAFKTDNRVVCQLATGAGKTPIAARIIKDAIDRQVPTLFVAHREELLTQAHSHLMKLGVYSGIIKNGYSEQRELPSQVASIQTLSCRNLPPARLIIADEAHHAVSEQWRDLFAQYPHAKILGLTATPCRLDGFGLESVFNRLICGPSIRWLIHERYLCPYRLFVSRKQIETKNLKIVAGDYSPKQLNEAADQVSLRGDLVEQWKKYAYGKRTLVFAVSIAHSQHIAEQFCKAGIPAEHLDGKTSRDERKAILSRLRDGTTLILSNCEIATEGFDLPAIECVQLARPTKSLSLALQMVGRALRPAQGKNSAIILDHAGLVAEHGFPDDDRTWTLEGLPPEPPRHFKRCSQCTAAIPQTAKICPVCSYIPQQARTRSIPLSDDTEQLYEQWREMPIPTEFWDAIDDPKPQIWTPTPERIDLIAKTMRSQLKMLDVPPDTIEQMVAAAIATVQPSRTTKLPNKSEVVQGRLF